MSKGKKKHTGNTRDAPKQQRSGGVMMCGSDTWQVLCGSGYRPVTSCPEVQICIGVYAELIASMTIHLMQNTENGDRRIKDELSRRLDINPNRYMTHQTFMENLVRVLLTEGNQVTLPEYNRQGLLENLQPLSPSGVGFVETEKGYKVTYKGKSYEPEEVLHFVNNPDPERPWMGTGLRAALRDVVQSLRQANSTKTALLENPAPSIIVKVDGYAEELQTPEGREALSRQYLEGSKQGKPWLLQGDTFEVQQVKPLSMNDLAIAQNVELDKKSVAAIVGVPAFLVGVGEFKAEEFDWFVSTRVMAKARIIEQTLTKGLLIAPDRYWRLNNRSLLNYDLQKVTNVSSAMLDRIAMDRNEARDWMGMAPREDMRELLALENYIPATKLGEQNKLAGGENSAE